jgi:hypothetical protein
MILELLILGVLGVLCFLAWIVDESINQNTERMTNILVTISVLNNRVSKIEKQLNDLTEEEENHDELH